FEAQAARTPDAVAVEYGDTALTYAELDDRANRLARHLAGRGAGPGTLVGVCLERGPDLVPAPLAALTTGAGHLPRAPGPPPAPRTRSTSSTPPAPPAGPRASW